MRRLLLFLSTVLLFSFNTTAVTQELVYKSTAVGRTIKAIQYGHRNGSTLIDFKGTEHMPKADGIAEIESHKGYMEIESRFDDMEPASRFGPEYLTYVLWAVTPE